MRWIASDRIKRGVLVASVVAASLLPATAAHARPAPHAPALSHSSQSVQVARGGSAARPTAKITGHKIG